MNTQYRQYDTNINTNFNIFKYNPLYGLSAGNTLTSIAGHFTLPCFVCQFDLDLWFDLGGHYFRTCFHDLIVAGLTGGLGSL